jgi:hypothetical protein
VTNNNIKYFTMVIIFVFIFRELTGMIYQVLSSS